VSILWRSAVAWLVLMALAVAAAGMGGTSLGAVELTLVFVVAIAAGIAWHFSAKRRSAR
jgi:hypothetical protein